MIVTILNSHGKTGFRGIGTAVCCAALASSLFAIRGEAQSLTLKDGSDVVVLEFPAEESPTAAQFIGSGSSRIASRRTLLIEPQFQPPQSEAVDSPSPSDARSAQGAQGLQQAQGTDGIASQMPVGPKPAAPVQSRSLRLEVTPVNTQTSDVGNGVVPDNIAAQNAPPVMGLPDGAVRGFLPEQVNWQPADICHFPPYFEDAMLERHGHVRWGCAQPLVSGAKFLTTIPMLPYLTTMHPPCEPRYSLGHFRPGTCAPVLKDHLPWDRRAATVQALSSAAFWVAAPL